LLHKDPEEIQHMILLNATASKQSSKFTNFSQPRIHSCHNWLAIAFSLSSIQTLEHFLPSYDYSIIKHSSHFATIKTPNWLHHTILHATLHELYNALIVMTAKNHKSIAGLQNLV
jgi:hypothetical protein